MLKVENADLHYPGSHWLFRDLTFRVDEGQLCAILGPNGSGKTTLIKSIMGIKELVNGSIERSAQIGHVPQSLEVLFDFTVFDMVLMGRVASLGIFATPARRDREAATEALAEVGMSGFAERVFSSLSGGERQLVLIARAIAKGADLILLDEPTAGLDLSNEAKVLTVLANLKSRGATLLMTTHDPEHALNLADTVLLMNSDGRHTFGTTAQCLTDAALSQLYGVALKQVSIDTPAGQRAVVAKMDKIRSGT